MKKDVLNARRALSTDGASNCTHRIGACSRSTASTTPNTRARTNRLAHAHAHAQRHTHRATHFSDDRAGISVLHDVFPDRVSDLLGTGDGFRSGVLSCARACKCVRISVCPSAPSEFAPSVIARARVCGVRARVSAPFVLARVRVNERCQISVCVYVGVSERGSLWGRG